MNDLELTLPSKDLKEQILQYKEEHFRFGDMRVQIACDKDNKASARTAINCGGQLIKEFSENGIIKQHYRIGLV